jgi:hypothetical protein
VKTVVEGKITSIYLSTLHIHCGGDLLVFVLSIYGPIMTKAHQDVGHMITDRLQKTVSIILAICLLRCGGIFSFSISSSCPPESPGWLITYLLIWKFTFRPRGFCPFFYFKTHKKKITFCQPRLWNLVPCRFKGELVRTDAFPTVVLGILHMVAIHMAPGLLSWTKPHKTDQTTKMQSSSPPFIVANQLVQILPEGGEFVIVCYLLVVQATVASSSPFTYKEFAQTPAPGSWVK